MMLSAEPGESCEARLHFRKPQELKSLEGLQFMVRSTRPKQRMAIELVGMSEGDPEESLARTRPFSVTDEWAPDALRFQHMKKGWRPQTIFEIRFIAMSDTGRSAPSLYIREVRFAGIPKPLSKAAAKAAGASEGGAAEIALPAAADIQLERQLVCVAANDLPGLKAKPPPLAGLTLASEFKRLLGMLIARAMTISGRGRGIGGIC